MLQWPCPASASRMDQLEGIPVQIALSSQSLFALSLEEAIEATGGAGFDALELACVKPHFDIDTARTRPQRVAQQIQRRGLTVAALSLFTHFTDAARLDEQLEEAETYIRLAPLFGTELLKLTPGPPGSAAATRSHWDTLTRALQHLAGVAEKAGVRLAFETHMRQLTDSLAGTRQLLARAASPAIGLTVDFSNLVFAGENLAAALPAVAPRMYNTHLKNGTIGAAGSWHFDALDKGLTDYTEVLALLRGLDYRGYLTIECLGAEARRQPVETARRDRQILQHLMAAGHAGERKKNGGTERQTPD